MATDDRHTPHELDQDQLKRSRGRTSRAARALNERSRDLIESRFKRPCLIFQRIPSPRLVRTLEPAFTRKNGRAVYTRVYSG